MTEGSPLKLILHFALPLLIGNLLQQTYNVIDAAIVGKTLGEDALAGVGASASVQFLVLGFCIGVACGFAVPIAQRFGAQDEKALRLYVFNAAILTVILAIILPLVCCLLCPNILQLLSTPDDIYDLAYQYLLIIFLGIPFTLLYNLLSGILRSVGDSRTPFLFLAFSTCLNIFLDLFCILVLKWGVAGAAIATITSQAVSGILCLVYILKRIPLLRLHRQDMVPSGRAARMLLLMGLPMGLQFSITAIGSMVMQSANNGLGTAYVTSFTASTRIKQFMMCPFDAIANAASVFCGQNLGARKPDRIRRGLLIACGLGVGYGIFAGVVLVCFGRTLSTIFISASSTEILNLSAKYLRYIGCFFWLLGILNTCRLCTQGLGFSGRAVFSGVAEMIARTVVCLGFVSACGYTAICLADQAAWFAACLYIVPTCMICVKKVTAE
jgi:putative MATE family efflux protein